MKSMTQDAEKYFLGVANDWDSIRSGYFTEAVRESAIHKSHLHPGMVVADVGAGTGFLSAGLAPLVKEVHVVDGSSAMLETARRNLSNFDNLVYHLADGLSLPFDDGSLDAVFANMYLHHCPDPLASIREMVRVLKPGGRLTITDMDSHPYEWLKSEIADIWQGFDRGQVSQWYAEADLVNVLLDRTGESCNSESANPATADDQRKAEISIFVATGSKRVAAHESVQAGYGARAEAGGSCCSPAPGATQSSCCTPAAETLITNDAVLEFNATPVLYSPSELGIIPTEAAEISLGCGNPTALAGLQPGETVLDIGSGGGIDVFLAARKVGPQGRAIGVDMTPAMLERARRTAAKAGLSNVEFRQGYAEKMPVEDGTVDVIISNCVVNLTEDKAAVWREAYRVLRPGGRVEVSDVATSATLPLHLRLDAQGWSECITGAIPLDETIDLMKQAGFHDITTQRSPETGTLEGVEVFSTLFSARK
jgi:ubiquinone/menaquinone biosynthesis C-methylase UbiE